MQRTCDECKLVYDLPLCGMKAVEARGYGFCGRACASLARRKGGKIFARTQATCALHGITNPGQSHAAQEKRRLTCIERYGVPHHWQNSTIRNKTDWHTRNRRGHETMKREGTYGSSRAEERLHTALVLRFGSDNVERQALVQQWPIDFHVKSLDTYVQLDGVYWHGLDRPIEQIRASSIPRDRQIVKKWETDRRQDAWFAEQGLRLVRVTDVELKSSMEKTLERINA